MTKELMRNDRLVKGASRAKGINFRSFVVSCRRLLGDATFDKMNAVLREDLGRQLSSGAFVTGNWYALSDFLALHEAAQKVSGRGPELAYAIGRESALDDFRGIYRVLTFVLSPEFLLKRTPAIWNRYYDTGVVTVEAKRGFVHLCFRDASGFKNLLWQDVAGGCAGVLEVCGAKDLRLTVMDGGGDENHMSLTAKWS